MTNQAKLASRMRTSLEHLKHHVPYPTNRKGVLEACNKMSDYAEDDRSWFNQALPEGNYRNPEDVLRAVLTKL